MADGLVYVSPDGKEEEYFYEHEQAEAEKRGWKVAPGQQATTRDLISGETRTRSAEEYRARSRTHQKIGQVGELEAMEAGIAGEKEDIYSGFGYGAAAFGAGVARGVTLGGSDWLLAGSGLESTLRDLKEIRGGESLAGELTGIIGTSVLTGGAGGAARGGQLGSLLARTPAGMVTSAAARFGAQGGFKRAVAAEAFEGLAFGVGQGISNLALTNEPLTAEVVASELLSNGAIGFAGGAVTAGALHGGRRLWGAAKGLRKSKSPVDELFDETTEVGGAFTSQMAAAGKQLDDIAENHLGAARTAASQRAARLDANAEFGVMAQTHATNQRLASQMLSEVDAELKLAGEAGKDILKGKTAVRGMKPELVNAYFRELRNIDDLMVGKAVSMGETAAAQKAVRQVRKAFRSINSARKGKDMVHMRKALEAYEGRLANLADEVGMDFDDMVSRLRHPLDDIEVPTGHISHLEDVHALAQDLRHAETRLMKLGGLTEENLRRASSRQITRLGEEVAAYNEAVLNLARAQGRNVDKLAQFADEVPHVFNDIAHTLKKSPRTMPKGIRTKDIEDARARAYEALGVPEGETLQAANIKNLFKDKTVEESLEAVESLNDYFRAVKNHSKGDKEALTKLKSAFLEIENAVDAHLGQVANRQAVQGLGWKDLLVFGGLEYATPNFEGPLDDIAKLIVAHKVGGKITQASAGTGGKLRGAVASMLESGIARGVSQKIYQRQGGAAMAAAGGMAARHGTRGLTNRIRGGQSLVDSTVKATSNIAQAVHQLASGAAKTVSRGGFSATTTLKAFNGYQKHREKRTREKELINEYYTAKDNLQRIIDDGGDTFWTMTEDLRDASPGVGDKVQAQVMRDAEFLMSKAPKDPGHLQTLGKSKWRPDELAVRRWSRYVQAVIDPQSVIDGVADGTISPQAAEALRVLRPAMFQELQREIFEQQDQLRENTTFDQRLRLSVLSGVPVESAARSDYRMFIQQQYAERAQKQGQQSGPGPGAVKPEQPTQAQRLLGR